MDTEHKYIWVNIVIYFGHVMETSEGEEGCENVIIIYEDWIVR